MDEFINNVVAYYRDKFEKYGASPEGVDWNGSQSQKKRFEIQVELVMEQMANNPSILDFGCGYGAMATYLQGRDFRGTYTGYDIVDEYIQFARQSHSKQPNYRFVSELQKNEKFEILFSSGIFYVVARREGSWLRDFVRPTIDYMVTLSKICIFNFLKPNPDTPNEKLFFVSKEEILELFTKDEFISECVEEYGLWEWTLKVTRIRGELQ